ncbi:MAG TPA: hypothetical protein DC022_10530, partial [Alcanivorax sp.]|nr:hypothetical protein [Alcanivorax sp.]
MPTEGGNFFMLKQAIFNPEMQSVVLLFLREPDGGIEAQGDAIDHNAVLGFSRLERYREGGRL